MRTERGLDRLTFFTDAICAIAITLLILPVVDRVAEGADRSPGEWVLDSLPSLLAFVLSFAVIARLWMSHHELFEHVAEWSPRLRWLSLAWAFTIAFLPLPTAMLPVWSPNTVTAGLYIGTMLASSLLTTVMVLLVRGSAVEDADNPVSRITVRWSVVTTVEFALAFTLGQIPGVTYLGILALALAWPLRFVFRILDSRRSHG